MKNKWHLSASLIGGLKACPWRTYLHYVLGLIPIKEKDSLRQGTNWHAIQEVRSDMDAVMTVLNEAYSEVPPNKSPEEWAVERVTLLYSLCGYNWYYESDDYEVVATEIPFKLPLRNPQTNRALPKVSLTGKIDKLTRSPNGIFYIDEHKSTSKPIDGDSTYWSHLNLDTQTTLYPYAAQQLQQSGQLRKFGIEPSDPLISNVRYDVWHKPGIKPVKLTQADTKAFLETGNYLGEHFDIGGEFNRENRLFQMVNTEEAEVVPGAKKGSLAIRETPEMFGTRLLADIAERPTFYFARREITRTAEDIRRFENELYSIYQTLKFMDKNDAFWKNEQQCEAKFRCDYMKICYNNINVTDGSVPEGFECMWNKEKK